jgi:hypothetical protein
VLALQTGELFKLIPRDSSRESPGRRLFEPELGATAFLPPIREPIVERDDDEMQSQSCVSRIDRLDRLVRAFARARFMLGIDPPGRLPDIEIIYGYYGRLANSIARVTSTWIWILD